MKKLLFIPLLFITVSLSAFPIGEKKAREIATQFFAQTVTRGAAVNLELEWAGVDINAAMTRGAVGDVDEALMYIYNRADSKGFVIVSGDNSTRPIIAYSNEGDFEVGDMPDAARWMLSCWCDQIEASRAANIPPLNGGVIFDDEDDEVDELLYETAKWNQGEPYNRLSPN
ncbi:MAG: Spi family protease inhibitor [Alistipes sp.]|nr:Spi family protease inhibitor [Alistipes sp.]